MVLPLLLNAIMMLFFWTLFVAVALRFFSAVDWPWPKTIGIAIGLLCLLFAEAITARFGARPFESSLTTLRKRYKHVRDRVLAIAAPLITLAITESVIGAFHPISLWHVLLIPMIVLFAYYSIVIALATDELRNESTPKMIRQWLTRRSRFR